MPEYLQSIQSNGITKPPAFPVRTMAEWEEIQALTIAWRSFPDVLSEIVRYAQNECKVIIFCPDSNNVKSDLSARSVSIDNIEFVVTPTNSVWIRDYGANNIYKNEVDSLMLVDWIYNRPRPADDTIPSVLSRIKNIPLFQMTSTPYSFINTGGNFIPDGFGTAFASRLQLDENPGSTEVHIDSIMNQFMGIKRYVKLPNLPYDGIHHIDMHMKLLDEETLLVGKYPDGISDGTQIEANLQYILNNYKSVFGTPFRVIRIPMPPDPDNPSNWPSSGGTYFTFTNAAFVNKTLIVPTYYADYDTIALNILRKSLPGYNVVGINCNQTIPSSGAIHCIVNCLGSYDPILISHQRLPDTDNTTVAYKVNAKIVHRSGINSATVYFRTNPTERFITVKMKLTDAANNIWSGEIPAQPDSTTVYYYINAESNTGKTQYRPMTAPDGYWSFNVGQVVSVNEKPFIDKIQMLNVYPNPANAITCIPIVSNKEINIDLSLFNCLGRKILTIHNDVVPEGQSNYFFNASILDNGIFFIRLNSEIVTQTQQLTIRK